MQPFKWDNDNIREMGVYSEIPIETYHHNPFLLDGPSISSSGLKQFIERPSLYWAYSPYNPNKFEKDSKPHLNFGKAAHHIVGEEGDFDRYYAVRPETYPNDDSKKWNANSNDCKAWLEARSDKIILKPEDMEAINCIVERLQERQEVQNGILSGLVEHSMFAKFGRVWLRSRPDFIPIASGDYADTKFVAEINYDWLTRNIYNFGYHIQAAVCRKVSRQIFGKDYPFSYALVFVEKTPPYDVRIHQLDDAALDAGEQMVEVALRYFEKCIDRMEWPGADGFDPVITNIGIPTWAKTQSDNQIQYIKQEIAA